MTALLSVAVSVPGRLDVDLSLRERCTALVGASGAGKSTLLHVVSGLLRAPGARVHLAGRALDDADVHVRPEARGIGLQFQEARLFPHMTVRENLAFPARHGGRTGTPDPDACARALGIESLMDRRASDLSGGEARRVALARALAAARDLLLLDEPMGGLDEATRERVLPWLHGMLATTRVPTLLVTHRMSEATFLAGEVVALEGGRVVEQGPPLDVLPHFTTVSSRREEDAENLLAGTVGEDGASVHVDGVTLKVASHGLPSGAPVAVRLRAGDIIVGLSRHDDLWLSVGRDVVLYVKTTALTLSTAQPSG
jgi:molybdate transport system ATP-binding protein